MSLWLIWGVEGAAPYEGGWCVFVGDGALDIPHSVHIG